MENKISIDSMIMKNLLESYTDICYTIMSLESIGLMVEPNREQPCEINVGDTLYSSLSKIMNNIIILISKSNAVKTNEELINLIEAALQEFCHDNDYKSFEISEVEEYLNELVEKWKESNPELVIK